MQLGYFLVSHDLHIFFTFYSILSSLSSVISLVAALDDRGARIFLDGSVL